MLIAYTERFLARAVFHNVRLIISLRRQTGEERLIMRPDAFQGEAGAENDEFS